MNQLITINTYLKTKHLKEISKQINLDHNWMQLPIQKLPN